MPNTKRLPTDLSGTAGEYFVAAELSRRGYIASLTLNHARGIDIIAANPDATRSVSIQVKTNQRDYKDWMLNSKAEKAAEDNFFYVFVNLRGLGEPEYHVVPSKEVASFVTENHKEYMATPKRDGTPKKNTLMRNFLDPHSNYLGRWELLGL
jgi:hypothetical protein